MTSFMLFFVNTVLYQHKSHRELPFKFFAHKATLKNKAIAEERLGVDRLGPTGMLVPCLAVAAQHFLAEELVNLLIQARTRMPSS